MAEIKRLLDDTFNTIDQWFEKEEELRHYRPIDAGWTINEILEHIALTNHFLLILINKGTAKAMANVHGLDLFAELDHYEFQQEKLKEVGIHQSFHWVSPTHMAPTGTRDLASIRLELKSQLLQCLENLEKLKNGEGLLYKTTMTVNNLGKINVYEYIWFLAQHGQRHITQMQKNEEEYNL